MRTEYSAPVQPPQSNSPHSNTFAYITGLLFHSTSPAALALPAAGEGTVIANVAVAVGLGRAVRVGVSVGFGVGFGVEVEVGGTGVDVGDNDEIAEQPMDAHRRANDKTVMIVEFFTTPFLLYMLGVSTAKDNLTYICREAQ